MKVVPEEISNAISNAARKIAGLGATVIDPADMLLTEEERKELVDTLNYRFLMEFPYSMDHYLKTLVDCKVKTAKELAAYNEVRETSRWWLTKSNPRVNMERPVTKTASRRRWLLRRSEGPNIKPRQGE